MSSLLIFIAVALLAMTWARSPVGLPYLEGRFRGMIEPGLVLLNRETEVDQWFQRVVLACLAGFGVGWTLQGPMLALILVAAAIAAPLAWVERERRKRTERFESQLPSTLDSLASALRAGQSLQQAVSWVANESPQPTSDEFNRLARELALGQTIESGLERVSQRLSGRGLRTVTMTVGPLRRMGANLIPAFEGMADMLRRRTATEEKLTTLTAQARMQLWVMGGILPVLVGLLYLIAPEFIGPLFRTQAGNVVLGMAGVVQVLGLLMARRILNPDRMWKAD